MRCADILWQQLRGFRKDMKHIKQELLKTELQTMYRQMSFDIEVEETTTKRIALALRPNGKGVGFRNQRLQVQALPGAFLHKSSPHGPAWHGTTPRGHHEQTNAQATVPTWRDHPGQFSLAGLAASGPQGQHTPRATRV